MEPKKRNIIVIAVFSTFIIVMVILSVLSERVIMNDGEVSGNTPGNLNNGGLFCESDGVVYFSNAYDNGCLYSMNTDETKMKKLTKVSASYINADEHYLYFYLDSFNKGPVKTQRTYGLFRSKLNGGGITCLKRNNITALQLCGNYIYYQLFDNDTSRKTELYKIKIDKTEEKKIADYIINPACHVNGIIYYNDAEFNHNLYALNTQNDVSTSVWDGSVWNPVYDNGYIYFMDVSHNYRLCRYSMSQNIMEVLTEDRVDYFNLYGSYIYYQKSSASEPALMRMYTDGSNVETVAAGTYNNINITSQYVYFTEHSSEVPIYKTPTNGSVNVTTFDNANIAALKEND